MYSRVRPVVLMVLPGRNVLRSIPGLNRVSHSDNVVPRVHYFLEPFTKCIAT